MRKILGWNLDFLTSFSRGPGICPLQWLHFGIWPWNMSITVTTLWNMSRECVHYSDCKLEYIQGICPLQWLHFGICPGNITITVTTLWQNRDSTFGYSFNTSAILLSSSNISSFLTCLTSHHDLLKQNKDFANKLKSTYEG